MALFIARLEFRCKRLTLYTHAYIHTYTHTYIQTGAGRLIGVHTLCARSANSVWMSGHNITETGCSICHYGNNICHLLSTEAITSASMDYHLPQTNIKLTITSATNKHQIGNNICHNPR